MNANYNTRKTKERNVTRPFLFTRLFVCVAKKERLIRFLFHLIYTPKLTIQLISYYVK